MNLEATRDKLEEARFFLRYLDEAQNRPQSQTQTPFRYHLSAFLGATYSVGQYLQTEVVRAMRQQARTQVKNLSKQQAGKQYNILFWEWFTDLPPEKQSLWDSLMNNRGSEIHMERTKTVTKKKAIPSPLTRDFSYRSERSGAHVTPPPLVLLVSHQISPYHPDITEATKRELGFPAGTNAWTYVQEHHLKIAGALHDTVKACGDYVALFDGLISHFEKSAP